MKRESNARGAARGAWHASLAAAASLLLGLMGANAGAAGLADLGEVKGKLVWVDFWASWCEPCRRSFPWLNQMQARYAAQGLEVIGINLDTDKAAAQKFLHEVPAHFTLKFDPEGKLATKFEVQAMPSSFLLDASGNIVASHLGFRPGDTAQYEAQIKKALSGNK
ncbi:MAG TPA: TlpA disulfide reductase family protein [Gammaproteobacteria bacterium]|jgi:thiol-disulfide isomerase/thioredoxin|nr:TlpA disulfide reductase family protein [Gammaproteobacteria bacterium]